MFSRFTGRQRVAPLAERRVAAQLREALAGLPAPWVVLANRRASGADGPPWVRFLALHPEKGIALVDTEAAEAAVAPLEDFLARTGFPALQAGSMPIVPVAVGAGEVAVVGDLLDAAFGQAHPALGNQSWCEAVVELLLAAPDLMLAQLRRGARQTQPAVPDLPSPSVHQPAGSLRPEPSLSPAAAPPRGTPRAGLPRQESTRTEPPRTEPVRLVPRHVAPQADAPPTEAMRLVPRRVAAQPELPLAGEPRSDLQPPAANTEFPLDTRRPARRAMPHASDEPQFRLAADERRFALEADEPIIPMQQTRVSHARRNPSFGAGPRRADAAWNDARPRRRWPVVTAAAFVVLAAAVGAIALWYRQGAPSTIEAAGPTAPMSSTTASTSSSVTPSPAAQPAPTATASRPTPAPPHVAAAPKPAHTITADDLPRAMLQPQIVSAPPTPLPLPAAKQPAEPVRIAATPKPAHVAAANTHPVPAADATLPAPIAAVLHPETATPTVAPPAPVTAPPSATAVTSATPMGSAAPTGGTVTVNGITYVNGEQPHSLGSISTGSVQVPAAPSLASNSPAPLPAASQPRDVVISRAPAAMPAATASSIGGSGPSAVANGPPREVVISRAPTPASDAPPPGGAQAIPGNTNPPDASTPPSGIQVTPLNGGASP